MATTRAGNAQIKTQTKTKLETTDTNWTDRQTHWLLPFRVQVCLRVCHITRGQGATRLIRLV